MLLAIEQNSWLCIPLASYTLTPAASACVHMQVDAVKRNCIKVLPHTLVIHLKRFEFDFEAMSRWKIKSRCCPDLFVTLHVHRC